MRRFMDLRGFGSPFFAHGMLAVAVSISFGSNKIQAEVPQMAYSTAGAVPNAAVTSTIQTSVPVTWHETLDSGWAEAKSRNLPMVIFITSDHCHYCDAMKRDTWCDRQILQRLAQQFVAIRLDPKRNAKTLSRIKVTMFPTTLIGVPEGKITEHRLGYQPAAAIHQLLSKVKSPRQRVHR